MAGHLHVPGVAVHGSLGQRVPAQVVSPPGSHVPAQSTADQEPDRVHVEYQLRESFEPCVSGLP